MSPLGQFLRQLENGKCLENQFELDVNEVIPTWRKDECWFPDFVCLRVKDVWLISKALVNRSASG